MVYEAYEKGMKQIQEIFEQKFKEKEEQAKLKELAKKEKIKQMEEKNRLKEWESEVNT